MRKKQKPAKKVIRNVIRKKKSVHHVARVTTGVENLDSLTDGGFIEKSITLVAGGAGSGKTIFAMQFLWEGLKKGDACLYITFEEHKEKSYEDFSGFHWDFEAYEKKKKFFYLEYSPEQVRALIEEGGGTVDQLILKYNIKRLVIDSITSFYLLYQDEGARKAAGLALFELINKWGSTAVLTSQAVVSKDDLMTSSLEFEADNIILLYHFRVKGERRRALEILKMRGTHHSNRTMEFEITLQGLVIHPSRVKNK